jgi:hypothetical protein
MHKARSARPKVDDWLLLALNRKVPKSTTISLDDAAKTPDFL